MTGFRPVLLALAMAGCASAAQAGLEICNQTDHVQSVSIGYKGDDDWRSEGWWNIESGDCATVVAGDLQKRYYYYRAEVNGGDFPGEGYMFCTTPEVYEIDGDTNCESRGYDSESFREIDTGESARDFTFTLVSEGAATAPRQDDGPKTGDTTGESGLTICNSTTEVQSVSIGYENDQGFVSEGWWNVEPDDCALVLAGDLQRRYYYYRAEVNAADFAGGEGYMFCTTPEVYTIQGDSECEARGYDSESFAEIDTGPTARGHTFYITSDVATPPRSDDRVKGDAGLEVCNDTEDVQSVAIGYEGPEDWTSEGWWNVDPGDCVSPALDGVNRRYIYYRAEVDGGEFDGQNYYFCTTTEAFKIVGDGECGARGYDRENFREVDTGGTVDAYTLTLVEPGAPEVTPPRNEVERPPSQPDLPQGKPEADDRK